MIKHESINENELNELWEKFSDIQINSDEEIVSDFYIWPAGTDRFEIWHWFDVRLNEGISSMLGFD